MKETIIKIFEIVFKCTYNDRYFRENIGFPIQVLVKVYDKTKFFNCANIYDFLMYFTFIKCGQTVVSTNYGYCKKTSMEKIWNVAKYMYENLNEIHIENWKKQNLDFKFCPKVYLVVDTTPFKLRRSTDPYIRYITWSVHYKMYCYKYQFIVNRENGIICDLEGPYGGNDSDSTIFILTKSHQKFPSDIYFFADMIYYGPYVKELSNVVIGYRENENISSFTEDFNYYLSSFRIIIENVNHRVKNYKYILNCPWRYSALKHKHIIFALSHIYNIMICEGYPIRNNN
jgi:hypothetical protein